MSTCRHCDSQGPVNAAVAQGRQADPPDGRRLKKSLSGTGYSHFQARTLQWPEVPTAVEAIEAIAVEAEQAIATSRLAPVTPERVVHAQMQRPRAVACKWKLSLGRSCPVTMYAV